MGGYLPHINCSKVNLMHWLLGVVRGHTNSKLHVTKAIVSLARSVLAVERLLSFSEIPSVPSVGAESATRGKTTMWEFPHTTNRKVAGSIPDEVNF
jgi:hypothetical protein